MGLHAATGLLLQAVHFTQSYYTCLSQSETTSSWTLQDDTQTESDPSRIHTSRQAFHYEHVRHTRHCRISRWFSCTACLYVWKTIWQDQVLLVFPPIGAEVDAEVSHSSINYLHSQQPEPNKRIGAHRVAHYVVVKCSLSWFHISKWLKRRDD